MDRTIDGRWAAMSVALDQPRTISTAGVSCSTARMASSGVSVEHVLSQQREQGGGDGRADADAAEGSDPSGLIDAEQRDLPRAAIGRGLAAMGDEPRWM